MAEIVGLSVFTNEGISCNGDLLQQAFQDVVDEPPADNEFMAFFKDDRGQAQTIKLSREQAAALGLTFEVDSLLEEQPDLGFIQENVLDDIQQPVTNESCEEPQIDHVDFPEGSEWIQGGLDHLQEVTDLEDDENRSVRAFVLENLQNLQNLQNQGLKLVGKKVESEGQQVQVPQAPLQRVPVVLPQSQYLIKSGPTVLKPGKNVRLLPNGNKQISIAPAITNSQTVGFANSIQKSNFTNGVGSQASKNGRIIPQMTNGNSVRVAKGADGQIRLSPVVKTSQNVQSVQSVTNFQRGQQFYTTLSTTTDSGKVVRSQICNGNAGGPGVKAASVPTPEINKIKPNATDAWSPQLSKSSLPSRNDNSQVMFKRTSAGITTLNLNRSNGSIRPQNQLSVLKPQAKLGLMAKQNGQAQQSAKRPTAGGPQRPGLDAKLQNHHNPLISNPNSDGKSVIKGIKKTLEVQEQRKPALIAPAPPALDTRSLSGSDGPIQIVLQGNTFQTDQRLTQTQLKHITHVLQQRGQQESSATKEKVVYRVVFPEELDLRIRNPGNLKSGRGKRGRPKKAPGRHVAAVRAGMTDEETEEAKGDRKKVVARTRSGRLSRPPRHMMRDYKHLHPIDFMQPDLDDSDGGYSDYNTNSILNSKEEGETKELLKGLEIPKRKVSTHFRCSTCNKIYLGHARLAKHFEVFPDHVSIEHENLGTLTSNGCIDDSKKPLAVDPFKRKGKKRGPWAYVTPEAKSERRQAKLSEALSVCDSGEISKIAAKPVLNAQSLFDLLAIKSDNSVRTFLKELKVFMEKIREQAGIMLSPVIDRIDKEEENLIDLRDELLCDALGLAPGVYSINDEVFNDGNEENYQGVDGPAAEEPPMKLQKLRNAEGKENIEERLSSGFSESSDLSVSDFLTERKQESSCPEVLTALTLMPRNSSPVAESGKNVSKLLISSPQIQRQISDNQGFQKVDINGSKGPAFRKLESAKDGFTRLTDALDLPTCGPVFGKMEGSYEEKMEGSQMFIKLEPMGQGFIKMEEGIEGFVKESPQHFSKLENGFHLTDESQTFSKAYPEMPKIPLESDDCSKDHMDQLDDDKTTCKIAGLPMLQDAVPIISSACDNSLFSTDNLDPIPHLDYGVMDKHLMMDEKLVEQLHLDQSNLVDELVSERLKNIIPDNILVNNLMPNTTNLDTELDFEALSEEFNRNTRS